MRQRSLPTLRRSRRRHTHSKADWRSHPTRRRLLCELLEDRTLLHAALGESLVELAAMGDDDLFVILNKQPH